MPTSGTFRLPRCPADEVWRYSLFRDCVHGAAPIFPRVQRNLILSCSCCHNSYVCSLRKNIIALAVGVLPHMYSAVVCYCHKTFLSWQSSAPTAAWYDTVLGEGMHAKNDHETAVASSPCLLYHTKRGATIFTCIFGGENLQGERAQSMRGCTDRPSC